jgi:hypothetical protein
MAARGRYRAGLVALRNFADDEIMPRSAGCMAVPGATDVSKWPNITAGHGRRIRRGRVVAGVTLAAPAIP